MNYYNNYSTLDNTRRDDLVNIILEDIHYHSVHLSPKDYPPILQEIKTLFPKEASFLVNTFYVYTIFWSFAYLLVFWIVYVYVYMLIYFLNHLKFINKFRISEFGLLSIKKLWFYHTPSRINMPYSLAIKAGLKYSKFLIDSK